MKRSSKDKITSNEGQNFIEWLQENVWYLLNRNTRGDWEGEFTYIGSRGTSVIDYAIVNEEMLDRIEEFKIGNKQTRITCHFNIGIKTEERRKQNEKKEEEKEEEKTKIIIRLDMEAIQEYKENTEEKEIEGRREEGTVEEIWQKLKKKIHKAMVRKGIKIRKKEL